MNYKDAHVLVTGGAGFIGSHLVEALVNAGAKVIVLDNLSTGTLHNLSNTNHDITFINGSITDKDLCISLTQDVSHIFHLAACVSIPLSFENPQLCFDTNIQGTFTLLEAARINKVSRFIFSSSCAVYGEHTRKCSEKTPHNPTSPYGYSKLMGELYCQQYAYIHGIPTLSLRYFNVIGERQNPYGPYAGVYAKFVYNMQHNLPIIIYGDGNQMRDFITVKDVVKANMTLAQLPNQLCDGKPINIGTGKPTTINDMFMALKSVYPAYTHEPIYEHERPGDIKFSAADCQLYKALQELTI